MHSKPKFDIKYQNEVSNLVVFIFRIIADFGLTGVWNKILKLRDLKKNEIYFARDTDLKREMGPKMGKSF